MVPMFRIVVADVLEDAGLAEGERRFRGRTSGRKGVNVEADVQGQRAVRRGDGQVGLRIAEEEEADPAHPHHPPGHAVRAPFVDIQPPTARSTPPGNEKQAASSAAVRMSRPNSPT